MNYEKHCCVIYASGEHEHYSSRTISGLAAEAGIGNSSGFPMHQRIRRIRKEGKERICDYSIAKDSESVNRCSVNVGLVHQPRPALVVLWESGAFSPILRLMVGGLLVGRRRTMSLLWSWLARVESASWVSPCVRVT